MKKYIKKKTIAITMAACLVMSCTPLNAEEIIDVVTAEQNALASDTSGMTDVSVETADTAAAAVESSEEETSEEASVLFDETNETDTAEDFEQDEFINTDENSDFEDEFVDDLIFDDESFVDEEFLTEETLEYADEELEEFSTEAEDFLFEEETTASTDELNADSVAHYTLADFGVQSHTPDEIRNFIKNHPSTLLSTNYYKTAPSLTSPYSPGELSDEVKTLITNRYNTYRFVAGLNYDTVIDDSLQAYAQLGALTQSYNGRITHSPTKVPGMDSVGAWMCLTGDAGPNSVKSWIDDLGDKNIEAGHRQALLSQSVNVFGIGSIFGENRYFTASTFSASGTAGPSTAKSVVWPAQNTPISMTDKASVWSFKHPGIFSLLGNRFPDSSQICVIINGTSGKYKGKSWQFSEAKSDGIYTCDSNYNLTFLPNEIKNNGLSAGDAFHVSIEYDHEIEFSYDVSFFDLCNGKHSFSKNMHDWRTDPEEGDYAYTCTVCGYTEERKESPMSRCSHSWSKWTVVSTGTQSYKSRTCSKCGDKERIAITPDEAYELLFGNDDSESSGSGSKTTVIGTKTQKMKVSVKSPSVKYKTLKKKNLSIKKSKAFTIKNAKGVVTFKKTGGNKKITVSKAGKITLKKGLKKGTYKLKVKITATGNKTYKKASKTVTVKIKVK